MKGFIEWKVLWHTVRQPVGCLSLTLYYFHTFCISLFSWALFGWLWCLLLEQGFCQTWSKNIKVPCYFDVWSSFQFTEGWHGLNIKHLYSIHLTVCWKVTNCTSSWALSIAPAVHYCTHDVLMNTKTTFKFLVVLCWAVTGSAGWCVRSRFAWSAHEQVAMYADARLKLGICLLWVECDACTKSS